VRPARDHRTLYLVLPLNLQRVSNNCSAPPEAACGSKKIALGKGEDDQPGEHFVRLLSLEYRRDITLLSSAQASNYAENFSVGLAVPLWE
jgi:hypothetical protein